MSQADFPFSHMRLHPPHRQSSHTSLRFVMFGKEICKSSMAVGKDVNISDKFRSIQECFATRSSLRKSSLPYTTHCPKSSWGNSYINVPLLEGKGNCHKWILVVRNPKHLPRAGSSLGQSYGFLQFHLDMTGYLFLSKFWIFHSDKNLCENLLRWSSTLAPTLPRSFVDLILSAKWINLIMPF